MLQSSMYIIIASLIYSCISAAADLCYELFVCYQNSFQYRKKDPCSSIFL